MRRSLALVLLVALLAACSGSSSSPDASKKAAKAIVYVSLGDSFSSGEGAPPYLADAEHPKSCKRSDLAWPARLIQDVAAVRTSTQVACSGATTAFLTKPWTDRGLAAQIPTAPDPKVTLVTLTIGGNDMGFGGIVISCFLLDCSGIPTNGLFLAGLDALSKALETTVYPALRAAYPNARIVHVGYPRLTPAPGKPVKGCAWLSTKEQAAAAAIVARIDATIRTAIQHAPAGGPGFRYVDVTNALAGHELCSGSSWVQPVRIGGAAQAHPTARGHRALETAVARGLGLSIHG